MAIDNPTKSRYTLFELLKDLGAGRELSQIDQMLKNGPPKDDRTPAQQLYDQMGERRKFGLGDDLRSGNELRNISNMFPEVVGDEEYFEGMGGEKAPDFLPTAQPAKGPETTLREIAESLSAPPVPARKPEQQMIQSSPQSPQSNPEPSMGGRLNGFFNDPMTRFGMELLKNSTGKSFGRALGESGSALAEQNQKAAMAAQENEMAQRRADAYDKQLEQTNPMYKINEARRLMQSQVPEERAYGELLMKLYTVDIANAQARLSGGSGRDKSNASKLFYELGTEILASGMDTILPEQISILKNSAPTVEVANALNRVEMGLMDGSIADDQAAQALTKIISQAPK